jgi:predicted O-linked N-acetylglucosamine transferase (SPINDLY family)
MTTTTRNTVQAGHTAQDARPALNAAAQLVLAQRWPDAEAAYRVLLARWPQNAEARNNLGFVLFRQEREAEALVEVEAALALDPGYVDAKHNLATLLDHAGRQEQALRLAREVAAERPDDSSAHAMVGNILTKMGQPQAAIPHYREAVRRDPANAAAHSSLLCVLHYAGRAAGYPPDAIFAAHRDFGEQHRPSVLPPREPAMVDGARRLRVGYVSPDFRSHAVAFFFEPLLEAHDRSAFEVFCYANVRRPDAVTDRLRVQSDCWRDISGLSDDAAAALIRDDGIDVLVDLAGHTADNRLPVFARKPAPVQVTYLGYADTTGLPAMDYRFTDEWADPPAASGSDDCPAGTGEAARAAGAGPLTPPAGTDRWHTEELVRLPGGFLCYQPLLEAPPVAAPPSDAPDAAGRVTFGSFNNLAKVTPETIGMWAGVLRAVPGARLVLKSPAFDAETVRERVVREFGRHGVGADRLDLLSYVPGMANHLALYARVDVALDTFPYNGTTTTCEALWMGVPVVTLAGETHVERVGASLLTRVGLADLVAESPEAYVATAVALAHDAARRRTLRAALREQLRRSPLMDPLLLTRSIEQAYRAMIDYWRETAGQGAAPAAPAAAAGAATS